MFPWDPSAAAERKNQFFAAARQALPHAVNPDGSGRIFSFRPPMRESVWILPALLNGSEEDCALASRMIVWFNENGGREWNVFRSNLYAGLLAEYASRVTPEARKAMEWHARAVFQTYGGSGQPDLKFHGCNDNMPMMSTKALLLAGEALGDEHAYRQGVWNLNEFRRLLSRSAWESEFNSSTYSAITLSNVAKIAARAKDPEVRRTAEQCEQRLWAELLLHWHPGTKHSSGPQCRAYAIDCAGHNHSLQLLLWLIFGPELTGRDLMQSYFHPDGTEVIHFQGNYLQSVAEYCDMLDSEFHLTPELARLISDRTYPALTKGRSECLTSHQHRSGEYHTVNYQEESFSLGSVDIPLCSGEQTMQFFATYKRVPVVKTFRDASTIFCRYTTSEFPAGEPDVSREKPFVNELYQMNEGWNYTMQEKNSVLMLTSPNAHFCAGQPVRTLKLDVIFPAHYGKITSSIIGSGPKREGAVGESRLAEPVSVEAGEVFVHIRPLLAGALERPCAVRFRSFHHYEALELVNYEGPERTFRREELLEIPNGFVCTIEDRHKYPSLEAFHEFCSSVRLVDYCFSDRRFVRFSRKDVQFEVCYSADPFGVQTRAVNGRTVPQPVFETNQLSVEALPFMTGPVAEDEAFFPWGDSLKRHYVPEAFWLIGSRGTKEDKPYSDIRKEGNVHGK